MALDIITQATCGVLHIPFMGYPDYFHPPPGINDNNDESQVSIPRLEFWPFLSISELYYIYIHL